MASANPTNQKYDRARSIVEAYREGGIWSARSAMTQQNLDTELLFEFTSHLMSEVDQLKSGGAQQVAPDGKILAFAGRTSVDETAKLQTQLDEAQEKVLQLELKLKEAGNDPAEAAAAVTDLQKKLDEAQAIIQGGPDGDIYVKLREARQALNQANIKIAELEAVHTTDLAKIAELGEQLSALETKIAEAPAQPVVVTVLIPELQVTVPVYSEILRLLKDNRKIEAIKEHRMATGLGLKESKDIIDRLERGWRPTIPTTDKNGDTVLTLSQIRSLTLGDLLDLMQPASVVEQSNTNTFVSTGTVPIATTPADSEVDEEADDEDNEEDQEDTPQIADTVLSTPTPKPKKSAAKEEKAEWLNTAGLFKKLGGNPEKDNSKVTFGGKTLTFREFRQQGPVWFQSLGLTVDARRNANRKPWLMWTKAAEKHVTK